MAASMLQKLMMLTGFSLVPGQFFFNGFIYNLRLWDYVMSEQQLRSLTCDLTGNVLDWDNSQWSIPAGLAQTDQTLSCSEFTLTLTDPLLTRPTVDPTDC